MQKVLATIFSLLLVIPVLAQESYLVSGTVSDAQNNPLEGVSVIEQGTTKGTMTDATGSYNLSASSGEANIIFSYVGYANITQKARDVAKTLLMTEEATNLDDVVVIGYGTQTKKELTGAITSVKSESFNHGIQSNPMGLVQGKVAGLTIIKNGGDDPAQNSYQVILRGTGSLKGNATPLYIIDGVPGGDMSSILPNDIASIDILKDGSAAAIYGTRANHGVILVTTKRGQAGRAMVEYDGGVSVGFIAKRPRTLTASEYREYMVNTGRGVDLGGETNWMDEIIRTPISNTHAVSLSGGTDKFNYRASVGYRNIEGVAINSDFQEINGRFAANQKALKGRLDISYDFSYSTNQKTWADYDVFNQAVRVNPTQPIRSADPAFEKYNGYYETNAFYSYNPVAAIDNRENDEKDKVMLGSIRAGLNITDHLKYTAYVSLQEKSVWNGRYTSRYDKRNLGLNGVGDQEQRYDELRTIENTLQYNQSIDSHVFSVILGQSYQYSIFNGFKALNSDFPLDNIMYNNLDMGNGIKTGESNKASMSSYKYTDKLASFFARGLYSYNNKYYLNASVRIEGSSKFGPKADPTFGRWGIFPAVSGSWRINNEDFMSEVSWVNDLKLRVGYGVTGNMPENHYEYLMRVGQTGEPVFMDGAFVKPWGATSNENEYLKWEKKKEYNIGIDYAFLGNRLYGSVDMYLRNTDDLLWEYNVPSPPYPYGTMWDNYGKLQNKGIELAINYLIFNEKDYSWNVGVVGAVNKNEVVQITGGPYKNYNAGYLNVGFISSGDGETGNYVMRLQEGGPIGDFYGFRYAGIKSDGTWMFKTPAGGYTSNPQEADKQILGNAQPDFTFGINMAARYKQFDASINFRGQVGGLIFNEMRYFYENTTGAENVLLSAVDPGAKIADNRDASKLKDIRRFSDFYLENASYIKLGDVSLGYTFKLPEGVKSYISSLRLSLVGQNLFTITGYSGMDPEVNMSGMAPGFDSRSYYPHQRTVTFGATMTF